MEARNNETGNGSDGSSHIDMTGRELRYLAALLKKERLYQEIDERTGDKIMDAMAKAEYERDKSINADAERKYSEYNAMATLRDQTKREIKEARIEREDTFWQMGANMEPGETAR